MSERLHARWNALEKILRRHERWLIAFSGGCDSTFLVAAARQVLGSTSVFAVTAVSASLAEREKDHARVLAEQLHVTHRFLATHELKNPEYTANPSNRCFFCKDELFYRLAPIAAAEKSVLADGFNASDRAEYRPGVQAAQKWNVQHPLDEAELTKKDIRILSRWLNLPTWNKPASPCLASRLPYGTPVTVSALRQIEKAEMILHAEGFRVVRVRHYGHAARIEVALEEIARLRDKTRWLKVLQQFRAVGYSEVTIEPGGFRSGRLNGVVESARVEKIFSSREKIS